MSNLNSAFRRTLALFVATSLGPALLPAYSATPSFGFPEYFSRDPAHPMQQLAQRAFLKNDGYAEEGTPFGTTPANPLGDAGRLVARIKVSDDPRRNPLSLLLDIAGVVDAKQGERYRGGGLPVTIALVCRSPVEVCEKLTLRPSRTTINVEERVKLSWNPWSFDGQTFTRVVVDGVEGTLVTGHLQDTLEMQNVPWEEADLLIAFPAQITGKIGPPRKVQVIQVRASLLRGEFSDVEPSQRSRLRAWSHSLRMDYWAIVLAGLAFLAMGFIARQELRVEAGEDAPRVFGVLLFSWGWVVAAIPLVALLWLGTARGMWYYTVTGLLFALSGLYAFFGRAAAKSWYKIAYVLALAWTFVEWDVSSRQFFMQIGMPTLIGAYLWYVARAGRLESSR